jgi:hypothetical protein
MEARSLINFGHYLGIIWASIKSMVIIKYKIQKTLCRPRSVLDLVFIMPVLER